MFWFGGSFTPPNGTESSTTWWEGRGGAEGTRTRTARRSGKRAMKTFYAILANALAAFLTNTFVWFAVTFWVYLETKSVVVTSVMAGVYTGTVALSGVFLGSLVDRYKKKTAMLLSSLLSQQYQAEPQEAELLEASI